MRRDLNELGDQKLGFFGNLKVFLVVSNSHQISKDLSATQYEGPSASRHSLHIYSPSNGVKPCVGLMTINKTVV